MAKRQRVNPKKQSKLAELGSRQEVMSIDCFRLVADKAKFNFHYFDQTQFSKKSYESLTKEELLRIGDKIVSIGSKSLKEWDNDRMSTRNSSFYEVYGDFPSNSEFTYPKHVPDFVVWARFRLGSRVRLCGFVVPVQYNGQLIEGCREVLCSNTFYVVFYDHDHRFCPTSR